MIKLLVFFTAPLWLPMFALLLGGLWNDNDPYYQAWKKSEEIIARQGTYK